MRHGILLPLLGVLLLAGCGTSRPVGSRICDCQQAVRVPDKAFRTFLVDNDFAVKAGRHKLKPTAEGCALTTLECYGQGIHSLVGVEMFSQLKGLTCSDNPISELDLRGLPHLESLYCLDVPLERLDVGPRSRLKWVQLSYTQLDTLDLNTMPDVEILLCIFSPLTAIDITPCKRLNTLYIRSTQITEVDLSGNPAMRELHALDTPLRTLIVTSKQYDGDVRASVPDSVRMVIR